jgi:hypothetical protein
MGTSQSKSYHNPANHGIANLKTPPQSIQNPTQNYMKRTTAPTTRARESKTPQEATSERKSAILTTPFKA